MVLKAMGRALLAMALGAAGATFVGLTSPASAQSIDLGGRACYRSDFVHLAPGEIQRSGSDHRHMTASEMADVQAKARRLLRQRGVNADSKALRRVPTYVHVMMTKKGRGDVSGKRIRRQMAVLNTNYKGDESPQAAETGFRFVLKDIDRYRNTDWHFDRGNYRAKTRVGGKRALNIWLVEWSGLLGVATFPWDYNAHPRIDGVRVHFQSLPGGSIANYNKGKTATHEIGHWLGLWHTFQDGCTSPNDHVNDTPAQDGPTSGCPVGADTCSMPGLDPIRNYMDYSYDTCYNQFTPGQATRMRNMWLAFRA